MVFWICDVDDREIGMEEEEEEGVGSEALLAAVDVVRALGSPGGYQISLPATDA